MRRSRSYESSLLKLMILIPLTLDNMVPTAASDKQISLSESVFTNRNFRCEEPQSRAYYLKDLMSNVIMKTEQRAEQPPYIILQRCDKYTGCCLNHTTTCLPLEIYYDEFEIKIFDVVARNTTNHWIRVEQHRKCRCNSFQNRKQHPHVILLGS